MASTILSTAQVEYDALRCDLTTLSPFRALIVGPQADLHRYANLTERPTIDLGAYNPNLTQNYTWPGRDPGSLIDLSYAKVWLTNAYLNFFNDYIGLGGTILPVNGFTNRVVASSDNFVTFTNRLGTTYARSAGFLDRNCQAGDIVYLSATVAGTLYQLWTSVTGFVNNTIAASIGSATADAGNKGSGSLATSINFTAGPVNDIGSTANGSAYDSAADGFTSRTYLITVIQSSTGMNATTGRISVTDQSGGGDNQASVTPAAFGSATNIGTKGLTVTFSMLNNTTLQNNAIAAGIAPDDLVIGQQWTVTVTEATTVVAATSGGTYTNSADTTYIVKVSRGGRVPTIDDPAAAPSGGAATSGGSLAANTYFAKYTLVTANGETAPSPVSTSFTTASSNLTIPLTLANLATEIAGGATSATIYLGLTNNGTFYKYKTGVLTSPTNLTTAFDNTQPVAPTNNTATVSARIGIEPLIVVQTTTGTDSSGPTIVNAKNHAVNIGNSSGGLTVTFNQHTLYKGDIWYIPVTAVAPGAVQTLVLANELPTQFTGITSITVGTAGTGYVTPIATITGGGGTGATATVQTDGSGHINGFTITNPGTGYTSVPNVGITDTGGGVNGAGTAVLVTDLSLRMFINHPLVQVSATDPVTAAVNWTASQTYLTVNSGIKLFDPTWTNLGVPVALPVSQAEVFGEFREWEFENTNSLLSFSDPADIAAVLGVVDPDNPVAYGVQQALNNAPVTVLANTPKLQSPAPLNVVFCSVVNGDPTVALNWNSAVDLALATPNIYTIVPLTKLAAVQQYVATHVANESTSTNNLRRGCILVPSIVSPNPVLTSATTTDGNTALATIIQDPSTVSTSFTYLRVPAGNVNFTTLGVRPGDTVRYQYTVNTQGATAWTEYTVKTVLSASSLLLTAGPATAITTAQRVEIWRTLLSSDVVAQVEAMAGSYASDRVQVLWPDTINIGGVTVDGVFAAAAMAGLYGAIPSHQSLTNVQVQGFDATPRSTPFMSNAQLVDMSNKGVLVLTQSSTGSIFVLRDVTTDPSDISTLESMVRRNVDMVSYALLQGWSVYFGFCNNTAQTMQAMSHSILTIKGALQSLNNVDRLGSAVYDIVINQLEPHPTLQDRVLANLTVTGPFPLNGVQLTLVVG